jgi:5-methylcytosine-specific restriction enzyme subunit McrC
MLEELGTDVSFRSFDRTGLTTGKASLFEVFVSMFLDEAADLVRRGIRSAYVAVESEEKYVRGKIDFSREARKGAGRAHMTNLVHDELLPDRPENRLVKATLLYLRRNSRDNGNVRRVIQLLPAFEGVGRCANIDADLTRCIDDRSTRAYGMLIAWCRVFLRGESFTMFKGESVATALLFPMERVFEDYVGRLLKRRALHDPLVERVELQATGQWLFEGRRVSLRPDILCGCANGRCVVLDTKWKRVFGPRDLSVADMHQMYAYGQRYRAEDEGMQHVVLLYPWHEGVKPGLMPEGRHVSSDGVQVDIFFFDLSNAADNITSLLETIESLAGCRE